MHDYAAEMGQQIGEGVMLVEYGSGSSVKTRYLLDALPDPVAYVPVDISRKHLHETAAILTTDYPDLEILPVHADFTKPFQLPQPERPPTHAAVYFPGSTIGNFETAAAEKLLRMIAPLCGTGGGLLIGIDLQKDVATVEAAYNDDRGITAEFNLNLLRRINRELGGDFSLQRFQHRAQYDREHGRVEISLVSRESQTVEVAGQSFNFQAGEAIHTEYSHKYTVEGFAAAAAEAGLALHKCWMDDRQYFAVLHFAVTD